jgi:hypothetical protein
MSKYLQSNPRLVKEFNYKKNYPLIPKDFTINSNKKVWWLCHKGHEWQAAVYDRTKRRKTNCPFCWKKNKFFLKEKLTF